MVYAEFGGGGGQTECITGNWKIENVDSWIQIQFEYGMVGEF